jgi:hypothetical protein
MPLNSLRVRPTTYTVAVYVLAAVLLFEVVMVISVFWLRSMVVPVNFQVPKAHGALAAAKPEPFIPLILPPDVPNLAVSGTRTLLALPSANDKQTQMGNYLDQARNRRRANDLKGAVAVLIQAEDLDPRNPDVLQGLAETYYLLNDPVRSKAYWQRMVDLGPAVGQAYSLARDHVVLLNSTRDADALQAPSILGRTIYIDSVEKTPVDTESGAPMFKLRVVLMRKDPNMPDFDQRKLQPYVIFYQNTGDSASIPGPASLHADLRPHKGGFDDIFLFQDKRTKEALTVEYTLPVPGTPGPDGKPMGDYYGYVIGIYYDKTLQDVRSEPADLLTRLPLPDGIE